MPLWYLQPQHVNKQCFLLSTSKLTMSSILSGANWFPSSNLFLLYLFPHPSLNWQHSSLYWLFLKSCPCDSFCNILHNIVNPAFSKFFLNWCLLEDIMTTLLCFIYKTTFSLLHFCTSWQFIKEWPNKSALDFKGLKTCSTSTKSKLICNPFSSSISQSSIKFTYP